MLGFICGVADRSPRRKPSRSDGLSRDEYYYVKLLMYRDFYAAASPVIVCEGPSDNIYLTHAISQLANEFPSLADGDDNEVRLKVRLFRHPKAQSIVARTLGLRSGGGSVRSTLVKNYLLIANRFKAPGLLHPITVLYDNDDGGRKVAKVAKDISHSTTKVTSDEPFVFIGPNVYLVPVPRLHGKDTKMEDLFGQDAKNVKLGGKIFSDSNKSDPSKEYGKMIFATQVVEQRADTIDFTGFRPLLTNLAASITDYQKEVTALTA